MTAEQRWILDLLEILTLRLECARCGTAVVLKPLDWREAPVECPGCHGFWGVPYVAAEEESSLQRLGMGLKGLIAESQAAGKSGHELPYRVKLEIKDPSMSKYLG